MAQAVIFDSKKAIYFFDKLQHFPRVLFIRGLLAQVLPAFSRLTLHRISSGYPRKPSRADTGGQPSLWVFMESKAAFAAAISLRCS